MDDKSDGSQPPPYQKWKPQKVPPTVEQRRLQREAVRAADLLSAQPSSAARCSSAPSKPRGGGMPASTRSRKPYGAGAQITALKATARDPEQSERVESLLKGGLSCERAHHGNAHVGLHRVSDEESLEARLEELKKKLLQSETENKLLRVRLLTFVWFCAFVSPCMANTGRSRARGQASGSRLSTVGRCPAQWHALARRKCWRSCSAAKHTAPSCQAQEKDEGAGR